MHKNIFNLLIIICMYCFVGCSSGIRFQFQEPATPKLAGIKVVVLAPVSDTKEVALICNALGSELIKSGYYSIFDKNQAAVALEQHNLTYSSLAEMDSIGIFGKQLAAEAIIFVKADKFEFLPDEQGTEKVEKLVWTGEYERDEVGKIIEETNKNGELEKKKKFKAQLLEQHFQYRQAKLNAKLTLRDLRTGEVLVLRELEHNYKSKKFIKENGEKLPSNEVIQQELIQQVVNDFINEIKPKIVTVKRPIEKGGLEIQKGTDFAKKGEWIKAQDTWREIKDKNPTNAKLYYNLGLSYEAVGDYYAAEVYYKKASLLNVKSKLYKKAVQRIQKIWQEKDK